MGYLPGIIDHSKVDDEDMAKKVERLLIKISKMHLSQACAEQPYRIIVIDEVDCFYKQEKAFTMLIKTILKSQGDTRTIIIGIANSVDLPFRKKHSAISMRECMLLFEPYSHDEIQHIIENKKNSLFRKCVPSVKECKEDEGLLRTRWAIKEVFFNMIDDKAMKAICMAISQKSGDIRVAFDIIKSGIQKIIKQAESLERVEREH